MQELRPNQSRWCICLREAWQGLQQRQVRLHQQAQGISDLKVGTVQPVAWDSVIDINLETPREDNLFAQYVSFMDKLNTILRTMINRSPGDNMDDIDKHSLILGMFMSSTMNADVFS